MLLGLFWPLAFVKPLYMLGPGATRAGRLPLSQGSRVRVLPEQEVLAQA